MTAIRTIGFLFAVATTAVGCQNTDAARLRFVKSADEYVKVGRYEEAMIQYRNAVQRNPRDGGVRAKLAETFLNLNDIPNALGEYVRAADLLPDNVALQLKAGSLLLLTGQFDDAKARAEKVLAHDSKSVDALVLVANALAGLNNPDAAVAQIEDALRLEPGRSGTYTSLGALELSRGKSEAAHDAFQRAVELEPASVGAHLALGTFYWLTEQSRAAEDSFQTALALDPRNALTNRALANFFLATSQPKKAEEPLEMVFELTRTPQSAFALAEFYVATDQRPRARNLLLSMLSAPSTSAEADVRLAALDYQDGAHAEAYRRLAHVLATDASHLQAMLVKSALLLSDGKPDEGLAIATAAVNRYPDSTAALFALGRAQAARKNPAGAIAAFQDVLRLNPRATDAKIALAQLYLTQSRAETSIGFAVEALANEPANNVAQLLLVRGLLLRGELQRAEAELKQLQARFPDSAAVHAQMGMLLGRSGRSAAARAEFEQTLVLEPDNMEALGGLVALDLAGRDFVAARARVDARVVSKPTATLLALAARTYAASGDLQAAERFLRQAIDRDSSYVAAYGALGQIYVVQGKLDAARVEFEALVKQAPNSVAALTMLGVILQARGDESSARAQYERVLQVDPEAGVAANNLAWIYATTGGNLDVAVSLAQTALKQLSDVPAVYDTLGFIYYKKNLAALSVSTLKVAVDKDPENALYHFHLGLAYLSAGDQDHAQESLKHALALTRDFEGAPQAQALLGSFAERLQTQ